MYTLKEALAKYDELEMRKKETLLAIVKDLGYVQISSTVASTANTPPPHPPEAIYPDDVDYTPEEYAEEYEDEYAMAASYH